MPKQSATKVDETKEEKPLTVAEELKSAFEADAEAQKAAAEEAEAKTKAKEEEDDDAKADETDDDDQEDAKDTTDKGEGETTDETTDEGADEETTEEAEKAAAAKEETKTDEGEKPVELPEHFSKKDRKVFDGLGADQQNWLLERHASMEADYTRKTQEMADFRKTYEPVEQALAPHQHLMTLNGLTPGQLVARWAQAELNLQQRPIEAIRWLAGAYNVSLEDALAAPEDQDLSDPEIQALRKDVANLRSTLDQRTQADTELMVQNQAAMIAQFQDAVDKSTGVLLHPHAKNDAVLTKMVQLAGADRAVGRIPDLEDLYRTAVMLVPSVARQVTAAADKETKATAQKEAAKKAARAKKAGKSVTGTPAGKSETPMEDLPLREQLRRQLDPEALH